MQEVHFINQADEAIEVLKPARIDILSRLANPKSCPELASALGMTTQKVNYHMNVLKDAGLVRLVDERRKRGTVEGVYQARAKSFWFSPHLVRSLGDHVRSRDQASLAYLLQLAEDLQIEIGQMIDKQGDESIPSLGVNAQIQLRNGADRARFLSDIKDFFSGLAERYGRTDGDESGDNCYRLMLACYPRSQKNDNNQNSNEESRDE